MWREDFPVLRGIPGVCHGFLGRQEGIDVDAAKDLVMPRMWPAWQSCLDDELPGFGIVTAEQVHGDGIYRIVESEASRSEAAGVDALVTDCPRTVLGIVVADCCAVYLVDPRRRVIGLCHSGKKGTELGIVPKTVDLMIDEMGCEAKDIVAQLSPCIHPPHYELDISRLIQDQLKDKGVGEVHASSSCTASNLEHYYSYRREKGRTGRMLAYLAMDQMAG